MREIIPTIIPNSLEDLRFYMKQVIGIVPMVQVDVTDGKYVPSVTWPYTKNGRQEFEELVNEENGFPFWDKIDFEVDMMVQNGPEEVERWIHAGASRVIIHIESTSNLGGCIAKAEELDTPVTLALKPSTSSEKLEPWVDKVDAVQFMGNDKLGQHGVDLDEKVLEKIRTFHETHPDVTLAIDIGVRKDTISRLAEVGVTRFASGSAVFSGRDVKRVVEHLKSL